jgi:hypothetical protein
MKNAICLLTKIPNSIWLDFLNTFTQYIIYVVIDDNENSYQNYREKYTNCHFIQIDNNETKNAGFFTSCTRVSLPEVIAWDKALYYFSNPENQSNFEYIWFIEDDVFFFSQDTIYDIDKKYPSEDLLTNKYDINEHGITHYNYNSWHWEQMIINLFPPYYNCMVCATRFSIKMLECVYEYVQINHTLFFIEAMFPTLAKSYKLNYACPEELSTIIYRGNWNSENINKMNVYHCIKNIEEHNIIRNKLLL